MKTLLSSICILLALVGASHAQAPGAPEAPRPGAEGAAFFQPKMTGTELAAYYFEQTGRRVIVDPQAALIEINITILQQANGNKEEQIAAVEKAAALNGLAFVPSGPNEMKLLVVQAGEKGNRVPLIVDEADLPTGDNIVSYVMRLTYLRPEEAQRMFTQMTTLHPYGNITVVDNASALVIKESASLIRMFIELQGQIDVPPTTVDKKWFDLVNADAELVAEKLQTIIQAQQEEQSSARSARAGGDIANNNRPPGLPPAATGNNAAAANAATTGGSGAGAKTIITTDARQNSILLIGSPGELIFLAELIERFDSPTSRDSFFSRKLRYLTVVDFLDVAENALSRVEVGGDAQGQGGRNNRTASNRNSARNTRSTNRSTGGTTTGGAGGGAVGLNDPGQTGAPESLVVGKTFLVADTISNSIVVQGPPQSVKIINDLLDNIDVAGPQVVISTVFGQYTRNDSDEVGIDWIRSFGEAGADGNFAASNRTSGFGGTGVDVRQVDGLTNDLIGGENGPFNLGGLSLYGQIGDKLSTYVRAAAARGDFTILSRPTIYTTNNTLAVISSGTRIAVPTSTINSLNQTGNTNTNIEYRDVELRLEVIPLVNSADEVTLQISQLNDQLSGTQVIQGVGEVPQINKQELLTTVTVKNRQTVVLGGLITKEKRDSKGGIPLLSDIPGLGLLFGNTRREEIQRELIIFIRPEIIMRDEDIELSQREMGYRYEVDEDLLDFDSAYDLSGVDLTAEEQADGKKPSRAVEVRRHSSNWSRNLMRRR